MKNNKLWPGLWFVGVALITIATGIYNFKLIGGVSEAKSINTVLSILTYVFWIITTVQIIRTSTKAAESCLKISVALVAFFAFGALFFSPLTALFVSPIIGICIPLTNRFDLFLMVALLYVGIIMLDWLWVALRMHHKRKQSN